MSGGQYDSGAWSVETRYLCDGDHTATDCDEIDLSTQTSNGLPDHMVIALVAATCAVAPTVTVRGLVAPLGAPAVYASLTSAGTSSVRINPLRHRHIDAVPSIGSICTDLEVIVRLFYRREQ